MMTTRVMATVWLALVVLLFVVVGCQWGTGARVAVTPRPPATPMPPPASGAGTVSSDQKLVDGYLYVRYFPPCALRGAPAEWVAPIELTDLRSGSVVHLSGNGTLKASPKPDYKTEEGRATIEEALKGMALVKEIVGRPECPDTASNPSVRQRDGWPDANAVDIGEPPMPKVAIAAAPRSIPSPPRTVTPGWRGAYCWPVSGGSRECEDDANWEGFGSASALKAVSGTRIYIAVLGDDANPGMVRRIRVLPVREEWSLRKLGKVLHVGAEVHKFVATKGTTLEKFVMPRLPAGDYILIADYESPLGEVEYGFKVAVGE